MTRTLPKAVTRKPPRQRSGIVAGLDIGSSKIACFIASSDGSAGPVIQGIGLHASAGMQKGEVVDLEALGIAVGRAVEQAEGMAGMAIERVCVSLSGGSQQSIIRRHGLETGEGTVTERDVVRVLNMDADRPEAPGRSVVHRIPLQFIVDGVKGVRDPVGMHGGSLGIDFSVVTASTSTLRNLTAAVGRNHLSVDCFCSSAYAAALAALVDDEKNLGAMVIVMGAGVTSVSVFTEGRLVYLDTVPVGGLNATADIARGLSTPMDEAERIKTLHGSVLSAIGDTEETVTLPRIGEAAEYAAQQVELGLLGEIIRPRIEETFEMLMQRMEEAGFRASAGQRIVLTGGASQLSGLDEFLATLFDRPVRTGTPIGITGIADATRGPAFITTAGLLRFSTVERDLEPRLGTGAASRQSLFWRIGEWFGNNL